MNDLAQVVDGDAFDAILSKFMQPDPNAAPTRPGIDPMMLLMISMMKDGSKAQSDAAQRAAEDSRASAQRQMEMMIALITAQNSKPAIDPVVLALLSGKNNDEAVKGMMEMQRQQAAAAMEAHSAMTKQMMETQAALSDRAVERALENSDAGGGGGERSWVTDVAQMLGAVAPLMAKPQQAQPAPVAIDAPAAPEAPASATGPISGPAQPQQPARPATIPPPAVAALRSMRALHLGQAKKPHQVAASIPVVILADDTLTDLICKGVRDDVLAYVAPLVSGVGDIIAWLSAPAAPGQTAAAEWLADYILGTVRDQLLAIVDPDGALYPDDDDAGDDAEGDEPDAALAAKVAQAAQGGAQAAQGGAQRPQQLARPIQAQRPTSPAQPVAAPAGREPEVIAPPVAAAKG